MWWHWGIVAVVGAWVTLLLHELAHCVCVWIEGGRVTAFRPYPHLYEGHFFWGRMSWESEKPLAMPKLFHGAPALIKAPFFLTLWLSLGLLVWLPLLAAAFWEAADIINFVQGYLRNSGNDGGKFRRA